MTLPGMESNPDTPGRGGRRVESLPGPALGYRRTSLADRSCPPDGWREVVACEVLGEGLDLFDSTADDLLTFAAHIRSGLRIIGTDPALPADVTLCDGPMRGPCRVVDRIDESLRQGVVVGTLEGNAAVAEHRCHLDLDPDTARVTATSHTVWRPRSFYVLPGAADREARAFRRMVDRVVRALAETTSGVAGG